MTEKNTRAANDFLFSDVICHAMLGLYIDVAYMARMVPPHTRTQLLLKRLKTYLKLTKYRTIKADIRRLIHFGKRNENIFEKKMLEIQGLAIKCALPEDTNSDMHCFKLFLELLDELCEVEDTTTSKDSHLKNNRIYLNSTSVLAAFDERGKWTSGIEIYIPVNHYKQAVDTGLFFGWQLAANDNFRNHKRCELTKSETNTLEWEG